MTENTIQEIVRRAVSDAAFRGQLRSDPGKALAGMSLTADERSALTSGDPARLTALGVDTRMSKAFIVGSAGESSKVVIHDPDLQGSGALVSDETSGATKAWDSGLKTNETNIDATAFAPAAGTTSWEAHLRTNEGNIDTYVAQDPDASTGSTALEADTAGGSSWNAHLQTNEGNLDTGSVVDAAPGDAPSGDAHLTEY